MKAFRVRATLHAQFALIADSHEEASERIKKLVLEDTSLELSPDVVGEVTSIAIMAEEAPKGPPAPARWKVDDEVLTQQGNRVRITAVKAESYLVQHWKTHRYASASFALDRERLDEHGVRFQP